LSTDAKHAFVTAMEQRHGRRIRRFLSRRLGRNCSEAPDLAQEVYLRLLRVEDCEAIRNPQAYLYTIANHVLYQHALRNTAESQAVNLTDIEQKDAGPELQLEMEQRLEALGQALEAYSPRAYTTLILHRCDGIPLRQIATRLGVSYSMVKRYLAQALVFCQRVLDEMETTA
jgi:RNA polymerase sigma factor (sigma-70 family)